MKGNLLRVKLLSSLPFFLVLGLQLKMNYKRSLIATLLNPHETSSDDFQTCKKEKASVEGAYFEKFISLLIKKVISVWHVVEQSMDHGIDQVLTYASV
uniref:Uncharacterized protein n=1 Tax=Cucumis melo TaxID=3656 RepID=A0A9I9EKC5_CUCME